MKKYFVLLLLLTVVTFFACTQTAVAETNYSKSISFDNENFTTYYFNYADNDDYSTLFDDLIGKGFSTITAVDYISPRLSGDLQRIQTQVYVEPIDAYAEFDCENISNPFIFHEEKQGIELDLYNTAKQLFDKIETSDTVYIQPIIKTIQPRENLSRVKQNIVKRSSFSTSFSTSSNNRSGNIELATQKINGTVLAPNELFSFNDVVGERTTENGFNNARIIVNGSYVQGVGGGVCQVSTTLYNAVVLADLTVLERRAHSLPTSYVGLGFDAMVSSWSNFCFMNNTSQKIYIVGYTKNKNVYFDIYGAKPNGYVEFINDVIKTIAPENNNGKAGYVVETYKYYYTNSGNLINKEKLYVDRY